MSEQQQQPSVGRIVHYVLPDGSPRAGEHRAAVITGYFGNAEILGASPANLTVFFDQPDDVAGGLMKHGLEIYQGRAFSASQDEDTKAPGTWHWPERTDAVASSPPAAPEPVAPAAAAAATAPVAAEEPAPAEATPVTNETTTTTNQPQ
jgi:hypothetical protein